MDGPAPEGRVSLARPAIVTTPRPAVSVVMVTHGSWSLTAKALEALRANTPQPHELIVVDNGSRDETRERLSALSGVRVILNPGNAGFGAASNQGVAVAQAAHVLLLNTDAYVHPGWLEPLLEDLEDPAVAAVVPQFLHPDGSLQEAGALLARDGSVRVYGDGDDPRRGWFQFRRVVDTGGAACMLIRRDVFQSLGGFDPVYAPAYYEDADLCLRIARQGLSVLYEPRSVVTHERYGSSSRDAAIRLSERGRAIFVERWGSHLAGRPWTFRGTTEQAVITARDARATPRVLIAAAGDDRRAERAVRGVIEAWPDARATWMTSNGFAADPWRRRGVEVLDEPAASWLGDRLFHYDVVLLGVDERPDALEATQPQAARIPLAEIDRAGDIDVPRLMAMMASAGVAPARPRP